MGRAAWALGGYALFVGAVLVGIATYLDKQQADEQARERISILQARVAEAETQRVVDSVEVIKRVTVTKTLRDSFFERITDTVIAREYIYQTDTLRTACLACVASAARLKVSYDSLSRFQDSLLKARRPSKWDRVKPYVFLAGGFYVGAKLRVP
jgi:hypothetical protein